MLVLSSRGVVQSMNWVRDNADDPEIQVDAEKAKKAFVGRELKGKRIGVIGLGNVGSKVANACVDLGMDVYGYDPFISVEHAWVLSREVQRVGTLEDLCRGCGLPHRARAQQGRHHRHDQYRANQPAGTRRRAHQLRARDHH